jgi:hypothetical protein
MTSISALYLQNMSPFGSLAATFTCRRFDLPSLLSDGKEINKKGL